MNENEIPWTLGEACEQLNAMRRERDEAWAELGETLTELSQLRYGMEGGVWLSREDADYIEASLHWMAGETKRFRALIRLRAARDRT